MKTNRSISYRYNKLKISKTEDQYTEEDKKLQTIHRMIRKHKDTFYQYGLVDFVDENSYITILCERHGLFETTGKKHLSHHFDPDGHCPSCYTDIPSVTVDEFTARAQKWHQGVYDYSQVVCEKDTDLIIVGCSTHGNFQVSVRDHLAGVGCRVCGMSRTKISSLHIERRTKEEDISNRTNQFIQKAQAKHGDVYDYSKVVYRTMKEPVEIYCSDHGPFFIAPNRHIEGGTCPQCKKPPKTSNLLYLLRCHDTGLHKIGITTDNTKKRIYSLGGNLTEVFSILCDNPRKFEAYLHIVYADFNEYWHGPGYGNTEFFRLDRDQVRKIICFMKDIAGMTKQRGELMQKIMRLPPTRDKHLEELMSLTEAQFIKVINYMKELK